MPPSPAQLDALLDAADFGQLGVMARRIQEASVSFGLPVLTRIGEAVEVAAAGGDILALLTAIDDLRSFLAHRKITPSIAA